MTKDPPSPGASSAWLDPALRVRERAVGTMCNCQDMTFFPCATVFLSPLALSSSWNPGFAEEVGRITAQEMTITGSHLTYALVLDPACAKHFAAYGASAGCGSVMIAYHAVDGVPCVTNRWLLDDTLRGARGFAGPAATMPTTSWPRSPGPRAT